MAFLYSIPPPLLELSLMFSLFFVLKEMWEIDHLQWHPENQNRIKILERYPQSYANNFDLCKSLVPLTQKHNKFGSRCKSLKSQLGFVAENRRYTGKDSDGFSGYGKSSVCLQDNKTLSGIKYHGCVKPSSTKPPLSGRQKTCSGKKPCACSECGKAFSRKAQLIRHQRTERGEKPHRCNTCGKAFIKIQLTEHQRTHTGGKPHEPDEWESLFQKVAAHGPPEKSHRREALQDVVSVEKPSARGYRLKRHQRAHTREKLYGCGMCGKAFSQKAYLIAHQRRPTGEKPYECHKCRRTFFFKSDLTKHQRTHRKEKLCECSDCKKAFWSKAKLIQHQWTHTRETVWLQWMWRSLGRHVLIKHKKTHWGEKAVESPELEIPSSGHHSSLCLSELIQEQSPVNTVPREMVSLGTQSLSSSELLMGRNRVIVAQSFLRSQASVDNRGFTQGISLRNAVNVITPSVINYVLYVTDTA